MNVATFIFYFFILLTALAAIGMLLVKNVLHAALLLMVCLLAIAGIYVLLHAEFLAVTQILVYAGGVLVVILFGVMLSTRVAGKPLNVENTRQFSGYLVGAGLLLILIYSLNTTHFTFLDRSAEQMDTVRTMGILLMSEYVFPFEIGGTLLLISLVGAAVTASFLVKKDADAG